MYRRFFKRGFDFVVSLLGLLLIAPLFLLLIALLYAFDGKPAFFFQTRPGKDAKLFRIIKFRTMNEKRDAAGNYLPDIERITPIGRFLRKTSLDELPQLINVLKGEMSLVGPRPLLTEYLPLYSREQSHRHDVLPGITGWAQVNGRNAIDWAQKFEYDIWYVNHLSFWVDIKILLRTFAKIFYSQDVNASESDTMEAFNGNNKKNSD